MRIHLNFTFTAFCVIKSMQSIGYHSNSWASCYD